MGAMREIFPGTVTDNLAATVFRHFRGRMELLNPELREEIGLGQQEWGRILAGGWRNLVPEEFHPEVGKLLRMAESEKYTIVEFPVRFRETLVWLRIAAAVVPERTEGTEGSKIIGLAQDVTRQRQSPLGLDPAEAGNAPEGETPYWELCHDISGPLTSLIVQCDLLLEGDCSPTVRQKIEAIFSEALRIQQRLRTP